MGVVCQSSASAATEIAAAVQDGNAASAPSTRAEELRTSASIVAWCPRYSNTYGNLVAILHVIAISEVQLTFGCLDAKVRERPSTCVPPHRTLTASGQCANTGQQPCIEFAVVRFDRIAASTARAQQPAYLYLLTWIETGKRASLGAHHGEELPFLDDAYPSNWGSSSGDQAFGEILRTVLDKFCHDRRSQFSRPPEVADV